MRVGSSLAALTIAAGGYGAIARRCDATSDSSKGACSWSIANQSKPAAAAISAAFGSGNPNQQPMSGFFFSAKRFQKSIIG